MFTASLNFDGLQALLSGTDPVCGAQVKAAEAAGASTFEGKTYYFDKLDCKQEFDANSAKYAAAKT